MSRYIVPLGNICHSCHVERRRKTLRYDIESLHAHCANPYLCNEKHPNSPVNIIQRGSEKYLTEYTKAEQLYKERLLKEYTTPAMSDNIRKLLTKPTLFRVLEPDLAEFIVHLHNELDHNDLSTTIRHIIRCMKDHKDVYIEDIERRTVVRKKKEKLQEIVEEIKVPEQIIPQPYVRVKLEDVDVIRI